MRRNRFILAALAAIVGVTAATVPAAAQKRYQDIKYPELHDIVLPKIERVTLDNGMKLYLVEDHELPLITANARIRVGSVFEPGDKVGLASITGEVMRTGGTATVSGDDLDELLESIGASVETSIGTTTGSASMSVLKEDVDTGLKVLADVLMNPEFPEEKIDLAKVSEKSSISRRNDVPMTIAQREYGKLIYGADSPYARQTEYATVEAITRDDLIAFHDRYYHPNNVMLAVVGDFNTADMVAKVKKAFAGWKRAEIAFPALPEVNYAFAPSVNEVVKDDANQTVIVMGHIGIKQDNPDYFPLIVMNQILGAGGFSSRLFQNVRSRQGLAYAVGGVLTAQWEYPGPMFIFCMTKSETTVQAIRSMMHEVARMTEEEVTDEELALAKDAWLNSFVFNFDNKSEIVNRVMTYDYYGFPEDFLQKTKESVEQTTKGDVLRVAKEYLHPDALQILAVGNAAAFDEPLAALGAVNEIDVTIPVVTEALPEASAADLDKGAKVLAMTVQAAGGAATAGKIESYKTEAKLSMSMQGQKIGLTLSETVDLPDRQASVIGTPMGEMTRVVTKDKGWTNTPQGSQDMSKGDIDEQMEGMFRDWPNLLRAAAAGELQAQYLGTETVEGTACDVVSLSDAAGHKVKLFIDGSTHLPVKAAYRGNTPMGPGNLEDSYSMWQDVDGIRMPFKTQVLADGKEFATMEITSAKINGEVDETLFVKQ